MFVAVVFQAHAFQWLAMPRRQRLTHQPGRRGGKNAIWPDDLRSAAGVAITRTPRFQSFIRHKPEAAQAGFAGRRENYLAGLHDPKRTRLHSSHSSASRMPSTA